MHLHSLRKLLLATFVTASAAMWSAPFAMAQKNAAPASAATDSSAEKPAVKLTPAEREISDLRERIKRCADIHELSIRLSCYDDYGVELGYITKDRAKADVKKFAEIGMWQITKTDDGNGVVQTQLRSESLNKLPTGKGFERNVSLIIRCIPGKTEAMVDWKTSVLPGYAAHAAKKVLINYSTESTDVVAEEWDTSTDRKAMFAPDPIAFSRSLMNKKSLTFSFGTKTNRTSNTARFSIAGIEKALDEIVKACYSETPQ